MLRLGPSSSLATSARSSPEDQAHVENARTRKLDDSVSLYDKLHSSSSNRLTADMFSLLQSPQGGSSQTLRGIAGFLIQEKMNNLARALHDLRWLEHSD